MNIMLIYFSMMNAIKASVHAGPFRAGIQPNYSIIKFQMQKTKFWIFIWNMRWCVFVHTLPRQAA